MMNKLTLVFILLFLPVLVFGGVIYVVPNTGSDLNGGTTWSDAYATLTKAQTTMSANDTIVCAAGQKTIEKVTFADNVYLWPIDIADSTSLDKSDDYFYMWNPKIGTTDDIISTTANDTIYCWNFNIDCDGDGSGVNKGRHAFYIYSSSSGTLTDCISNDAGSRGFYIYSSSSGTLTNCISNDAGSNGFAITTTSSGTLTDCISNDAGGSGFYIYSSSSGTLTNCISNDAGSYGFIFSSSSATLTDCISNDSGSNGFYITTTSSGTLTDCISNDAGGYGFIFFDCTNQITIENCVSDASEEFAYYSDNCDSVTISKSVARNCRYEDAFVAEESGVSFTDCIADSNSYSGYTLAENTKAYLNRCISVNNGFDDGSTTAGIFCTDSGTVVTLLDCISMQNNYGVIVTDSAKVTFLRLGTADNTERGIWIHNTLSTDSSYFTHCTSIGEKAAIVVDAGYVEYENSIIASCDTAFWTKGEYIPVGEGISIHISDVTVNAHNLILYNSLIPQISVSLLPYIYYFDYDPFLSSSQLLSMYNEGKLEYYQPWRFRPILYGGNYYDLILKEASDDNLPMGADWRFIVPRGEIMNRYERFLN